MDTFKQKQFTWLDFYRDSVASLELQNITGWKIKFQNILEKKTSCIFCENYYCCKNMK